MTAPIRLPTPYETGIFARAPWLDLPQTALEEAAHVPTMLRWQEQQLYYWLSAVWARDLGDIVDLGCFVGGSTARLALGHGRARARRAQIHAFDRFTADEATKARLIYPASILPFAGNDILPLARQLLAPWQEIITLHPGEIEDQIWHNRPIELLISDAAKGTHTSDAIAQMFLPHLIAGHSLWVQQDFFHWRQPWLPAQMELLSECFTPLARCPGTTMIYRCDRVPNPDQLRAATLERLGDADLIALIDAARARLSGFGMDAALIRAQEALRNNPGERIAWRFRQSETG